MAVRPVVSTFAPFKRSTLYHFIVYFVICPCWTVSFDFLVLLSILYVILEHSIVKGVLWDTINFKQSALCIQILKVYRMTCDFVHCLCISLFFIP